MIDSSNNGIIQKDLKVEAKDVQMETELSIPPSELLNSTSGNKINESSTSEQEKVLNVPRNNDETIVATQDVRDDVNEPDVKEHDIKTESQESKTVEEKSIEKSETVKEKNATETVVKEDEELVLLKETDKVIEEIDTSKECTTETLPNDNSNSVEESHNKSVKTDGANECKNENVVIADSLKNSNIEENVAKDVDQCNAEGQSNQAGDSLGEPVKEDPTTLKKEESTDDDVAIVDGDSKEIVCVADKCEDKSECATENIANINPEKGALSEMSETKNVDSDIELIEDSTEKIDNVNENRNDLISTDKNTEDNGNIIDTGKEETDLEKEERTVLLNGSNVESDAKPVETLAVNDKSKEEINLNEKPSNQTEDSAKKITDSQIDCIENHQKDIDIHNDDIEIASKENGIDSDDDMDCGDNLVIDDITGGDSDVELVEDGVKEKQDAKEICEADKVQNDLVIDTNATVMDVDSPVVNEEAFSPIVPASEVILPIDLDNNDASNDTIVNLDNADKDKGELVNILDTEKDKTGSAVTNNILRLYLDNADASKDNTESNLNLDSADNTESVVNLDNVDKDKAESVVAEKENTESSVTNANLPIELDADHASKDSTKATLNKSKDDDDEIIFIKECKKASDCTCVMCDGKKKGTDEEGKEDNREKVGQKDSSKKKEATLKSKKDATPKIHEKLDNLTKKGLEKLISNLFVKIFAYENEGGKYRELVVKLKAENANIKSVCQAQAKQLKELVHLHDKAVAEIETFKAENNGGVPPMPVKITRSVGLQVKVSPPVEKKRPTTAPLTTRASLKRKRGSVAPTPTPSPRTAASQQARSLPSSPLASPKPAAQPTGYRSSTFSTMAVRKSTGGMSPRFAPRGGPGRPLGSPSGGAGGLRILPPRTVNSNAVNAASRPSVLSLRGAPVGRVITRAPASGAPGGVPRSPNPATITVKAPSSVETINLDDDDTPRPSQQQSMKIVRPGNNVPIRLTSTAGSAVRAPGQGSPSRLYVPLSQGIKLRPATSSTGNIITSVANTSSATTYILETSAGPIPFQTNSNVRLNLKPNATANAGVRLQYQGHPAPVPTTPAAVSLPLEARYKLVPAAPKLRVQLADAGKGIQLTWSLDSTADMASIESYQLYAYQENKAMAISSNLWKNIGKLEALPLPMACTLTQFTAGHTYHFLVRAIDEFKRYSAFSNPGTIHHSIHNTQHMLSLSKYYAWLGTETQTS
uniref:Activating transcription factor 7-interacting protein 1 n=1 Tax=Cacopsylla melanoneura TaxID=428564 RepID=A0A8D9F7J9_9HEMI